MELLEDVKMEAEEMKLLFTAGLNRETRENLRAAPEMKGKSLLEQVRYLCKVAEISKATIIHQRDSL